MRFFPFPIEQQNVGAPTKKYYKARGNNKMMMQETKQQWWKILHGQKYRHMSIYNTINLKK